MVPFYYLARAAAVLLLVGMVELVCENVGLGSSGAPVMTVVGCQQEAVVFLVLLLCAHFNWW